MGRLTDEDCGFVSELRSENALIQSYFSEVGTKGHHVQKSLTLWFPDPNNVHRVLITTNGFGMGVDIPTIYRVIHWGVSRSSM